VNNPLGTDVHPSARCHLAVVGHAQCRGPLPVLVVIEFADHEGVGHDGPWGIRPRMKQTEGVTRFHHQGLIPGQYFEVSLDQTILHPVLTDLAGFAVGHEFVRVKGHIEVKVVFDHDLAGLSFYAGASIFTDRSAGELSFRPEPIPVPECIGGRFSGRVPYPAATA